MGLNDFNKESEVKAIDTSRKLRIGVIGCGWIVGSHLKRFMRQPDIEIVAADILSVVASDHRPHTAEIKI